MDTDKKAPVSTVSTRSGSITRFLAAKKNASPADSRLAVKAKANSSSSNNAEALKPVLTPPLHPQKKLKLKGFPAAADSATATFMTPKTKEDASPAPIKPSSRPSTPVPDKTNNTETTDAARTTRSKTTKEPVTQTPTKTSDTTPAHPTTGTAHSQTQSDTKKTVPSSDSETTNPATLHSQKESSATQTPPSRAAKILESKSETLSPFILAIKGKRKMDAMENDPVTKEDRSTWAKMSIKSTNRPKVTATRHTFDTVGNLPIPAYKKYQPLVTPGTNLPLPDSYNLLEQMFHALEYTLSFMRGRDQAAIFYKLKKPVENMCKRNFSMEHLAKIRTVYPEAYKYTAMKEIVDDKRVDSVRLEMHDVLDNKNEVENDDAQFFKPWGDQLRQRREEFHKRLVDLVKTEHKKFLSTLPYQVSEDDSYLRTWHPRFDLTTVPDITPTPLPTIGLPTQKKVLTASTPSTPKQPTATPNVLTPSSVSNSTPNSTPKTPAAKESKESPSSDSTPTKAPSRAAALLARIREKEKKKVEETMFRSPHNAAVLKKKAMLCRLLEVGQAVIYFFKSSQKNVLPIKEVGQYVITAARNPLSHTEACDHVRLLAEVCPEWCKLVDLIAGTFVRVEPNTVKIPTLKSRIATLMEDPSASFKTETFTETAPPTPTPKPTVPAEPATPVSETSEKTETTVVTA
ncbi:replication licensing factor Cdt1 [Chytridiales sp. JEL 0842]|nr:replication licensing factor Cdt1 [Chytridiales sp. JEL 0842]